MMVDTLTAHYLAIELRRQRSAFPNGAIGYNPNNKHGRHPYRLVGELDGKVVWIGNFRDEDEREIFIRSLITGELRRDEFAKNLPVPAWDDHLAEWPVLYKYAAAVTDLGNTNKVNAGSGINVNPAVPVPKGSLIFIVTMEVSNTNSSSVSDGTNTYAHIQDQFFSPATHGYVGSWCAPGCKALSTTASIGYTPTGLNAAAMSVCFATNVMGSTAAVDNGSLGTGNSVASAFSVTCAGTLKVGTELFLVAAGGTGFSSFSWTAPFATPPSQTSTTTSSTGGTPTSEAAGANAVGQGGVGGQVTANGQQGNMGSCVLSIQGFIQANQGSLQIFSYGQANWNW